MEKKKLLTAKELATLLGDEVQEKQIRRWTRDSKGFPYYQAPGRRLFRLAEVLEWMKRGSTK
jgi:hypothetical protein